MYSEKTPIIQHADTPKVKLNDGRKIPVIGFGTWKIPIEVAAGQVDQAIELGFSHVDTAQSYRNETEAGQAIRGSGLSRDEIWVTTKWSGLDGKGPRQSAEESLQKLGLKYIDLLLIHHPRLTNGDIPGAWAEFEKLQADGLVKSIGVSNFEIDDLKILLKDAKVKPVINQILFHPYVYSSKAPLIEFLAENDIAFEAYSGLIVSLFVRNLSIVLSRVATFSVSSTRRASSLFLSASHFPTWRTRRQARRRGCQATLYRSRASPARLGHRTLGYSHHYFLQGRANQELPPGPFHQAHKGGSRVDRQSWEGGRVQGGSEVVRFSIRSGRVDRSCRSGWS